MSGWSEDDSSANPNQHSLTGLGTLQPGQSGVVTEATPSDFETYWWGSPANAPAGFDVVQYTPNQGDNLSTTSDSVTLFNSSGTLVDRLDYVAPEAGDSTVRNAPLNAVGRSSGHAARRQRGAHRVGLLWAGSAVHKGDKQRSIALSQFAPLGTVEGVKFYSLQKGKAAEQLASSPPGLLVHDHTHLLGDFAETAALIANLDLVITVDTSVAHLAGAMGKPVWVLLPFDPDWRWMLEREDSPWYPTMRLFRRGAGEKWDEAVTRAQMALEAWVSRRSGKKYPDETAGIGCRPSLGGAARPPH